MTSNRSEEPPEAETDYVSPFGITRAESGRQYMYQDNVPDPVWMPEGQTDWELTTCNISNKVYAYSQEGGSIWAPKLNKLLRLGVARF